jgi:hypothetical protein
VQHELQPLPESLSQKPRAGLFPAVTGAKPSESLQTYLDWLTMFIRVHVEGQTSTALEVTTLVPLA